MKEEAKTKTKEERKEKEEDTGEEEDEYEREHKRRFRRGSAMAKVLFSDLRQKHVVKHFVAKIVKRLSR